MYLCAVLALIIIAIIVIDIYRKNHSSTNTFCLYDKPVYYPKSYGLNARLYNPRCTAYCASPDSECVVWCQ